MVTRRSLSDCSNSTSDVNEDGQDTVSVATSDSEESTTSHHNELVLSDDANKDRAGFSNIAVTNSTDIHFGNKTYYQGPVTIKQFLYANPQTPEVCDGDEKLAITNDDTLVLDSVPDSVIIGKDNPSFVSDTTIGIKLKNNVDKQIVNGDTHANHPEVRKGTRWLRNISRQQVISALVAVVLLISLVTALSVFLTRHETNNSGTYHGETDELQSGSPAEYPVDPNVNFTLPGKLKIVTRREWLAQPPQVDPKPMKLPVPYVIILETATESCTDQATCTFHVRFLQSFHIDSRGWDDIAFNFLVGGDGFAYEGRGWKGQAAHTLGWNSKSIGIAFIGTFNNGLPPERQTVAAKQLIQLGIEKGYIDKNYKLLANRQVETTNKNPGLELYEDLQKWPHWYNYSIT